MKRSMPSFTNAGKMRAVTDGETSLCANATTRPAVDRAAQQVQARRPVEVVA